MKKFATPQHFQISPSARFYAAGALRFVSNIPKVGGLTHTVPFTRVLVTGWAWGVGKLAAVEFTYQ